MKYLETDIHGAWIIEVERHQDERGFFARSFCAHEFRERGLEPTVAQCNISYSRRKGTLRGMHSQRKPHEEIKLIRCTRGAIHEVMIDLRPASPTYTRHFGIDLTAENRLALYVPKGVYNGMLTLEDATEVFYQMSIPFVPNHELGIRWNDPAFGIRWPIEVSVISPRDASYPDYDPS